MLKGTVIKPYWGLEPGESIYIKESSLTFTEQSIDLYRTEDVSSFVVHTLDKEMLAECVKFEGADLVAGLQKYYAEAFSPEKAFELLDGKEKEYKEESILKEKYKDAEPDFIEWLKENGFVGYMKCMSTKAAVCKELLAGPEEKIYHHYPELDNRGYFEGDYDAVKMWEQVKFGKIVDSTFHGSYEFPEYEIEKELPEYKEYRNSLYQETVKKICEKIPDYLFSTLSADAKEMVIGFSLSLEKNKVLQTGLDGKIAAASEKITFQDTKNANMQIKEKMPNEQIL